jgi:hypothetical protein
MNRFAGLIITVVALAALVGAALGWRFPFPGGNRNSNLQVRQPSPQSTQQANPQRGQPLRSGQPTPAPTAAANNNPSTPVIADTNNTGESDTDSQPVLGMW